MRLLRVCSAATLAAAGAMAGAGAVRAADLASMLGPAQPYEEPEAPIEFGAGWYLRGDGAASFEDHPKLDVAGTTASFEKNATDIGYSFGGGVGYKFNSFLRFDLTADYLDPFKYEASLPCGSLCDINLQTRVWRWDGLANGYLDLGTWSGLTPYVGVGAGVGGTHQDGSVAVNGNPLSSAILDPRTGTLTTGNLASRTDYQFAWAAMAGFSYAFEPHMLLDVGYRYLDLGKTTIPLYPATSVTKELTSQQIRVGVRYIID